MRLYIEGPSGPLFDYSNENENALVPTESGERADVFNTLVGALALLSRVTPPSFGATAGETDQLTRPNPQGPSGRNSGVVVRLATRLGAEVAPTNS
jgi:hypothetical protein